MPYEVARRDTGRRKLDVETATPSEIGQIIEGLGRVARGKGYDVPGMLRTYAPELITLASTEAVYKANTAGMDCPPDAGIPSLCGVNNSQWDPSFVSKNCPDDVMKMLAWMFKALCSWNKFGATGSVPLPTNILTLPSIADGFVVAPDANSLGVFLPVEWAIESMYMGIHRVKVRFQFNVLLGALTLDQLQDAFADSDFQIIQAGTQDRVQVVASFGTAQDAAPSDLVPAYGGYFLQKGKEFVVNMLQPDAFGYSFSITAPGIQNVDAYTVQAIVRSYFVPVV
jgi:hypothetical protein